MNEPWNHYSKWKITCYMIPFYEMYRLCKTRETDWQGWGERKWMGKGFFQGDEIAWKLVSGDGCILSDGCE